MCVGFVLSARRNSLSFIPSVIPDVNYRNLLYFCAKNFRDKSFRCKNIFV